MRLNNLEQFTYDADREGSDFIDSLPAPEIKTTEDLIAAATPAPPAPKPTDAMLRGEEMSQTQFEGMEPVYQSSEMATRGDPGILLGYKFNYSQLPGYGMAPVYKAQEGRGGDRGPPILLGYEFNPIAAGLTIEDAPKPPEILAREKQFGTTMEPTYATYMAPRKGRGGGGEEPVAYGPPTGYRFDNGKSQYVNFDISGQHIGTVDRGNNSGLVGFALSVLSLAYPPIAPFIQAYNAVKAIDSGDTLGFILNAAGASVKLPGLDASTTKLLNNVSTGARIIKAVESKDPLAIASSMVNLPGVDPVLKDVSIVLNTANAISKGNIAGAINGITKMSDRDSVGRLTEKFDDIVNGSDVAALDPSQVAAFNPVTDEPIDDTLTNAGLVNSDVIDKTPEEQEQEDREQAAREAVRVSEKTIEDTLTDAGLVTDTQDQAIQEAERIAQEDREQAAREAIRAQEQAAQLAQEQEDREQAARDAIKASEKTIEDQLIDSGLVSKTDDEKKLDGVEVTGKAITDTDLPITDDQGRNRITDSSLPVNPNVGEPPKSFDQQEITGKRILEDDLPITTDTGGNRVTDSSVPVNPNVGTTTPTLEQKEVTGKREIDTELPITGDTGNNRITDSSLPVNPDVGGNKLAPVTVTGKRDQELDPVTIIGKREIEQELDPVTIVGKKEEPVTPKLPVIPKVPTVSTKPTPKKTIPTKTAKPTATPAEQLYQTTTQSNPTTLADIKYYLDMASGGIVPPKNPSDPLESLLNQPMSVEELLYYLRS
jgi:hypothetical protein